MKPRLVGLLASTATIPAAWLAYDDARSAENETPAPARAAVVGPEQDAVTPAIALPAPAFAAAGMAAPSRLAATGAAPSAASGMAAPGAAPPQPHLAEQTAPAPAATAPVLVAPLEAAAVAVTPPLVAAISPTQPPAAMLAEASESGTAPLIEAPAPAPVLLARLAPEPVTLSLLAPAMAAPVMIAAMEPAAVAIMSPAPAAASPSPATLLPPASEPAPAVAAPAAGPVLLARLAPEPVALSLPPPAERPAIRAPAFPAAAVLVARDRRDPGAPESRVFAVPAVSLAAEQAPISAPAPAATGAIRHAAFIAEPRATAAPRSAMHAPAASPLIEPTTAKVIVIEPGPLTGLPIPSPLFAQNEPLLTPAALNTAPPAARTADGAPGLARTLAQAIAYSYETHPQLLAERAAARSADYGVPAARAAYGPRIDASANLLFTRDRFEQQPGTWTGAQGWTDTAALVLSQPLFTFGRNKAAEGEALATVEFRRASLQLAQNQVMLDVVGNYVGVLRDAGAVTIARENVALLSRELSDSQERFKVREITSSDVQQVETRLEIGRTLLLDAQARLGESQARFLRAVGMPPGELAPPEPLTIPVTSLAEAYGLADTASPLIQAAQAREKVSRSAIEAARAANLPRVDLRGTADYGTLSDYTNALRTTRVRGQLTLSVPLFDNGGRSAEISRAKEANGSDWRLIEAAARDSRVAVATAWNDLLAARASLDKYRLATESAQKAYEGAVLQERAGMRTTLDVLDLARDLLNVRNSYNTALANEYVARATLLAAMGQLDPQRLAPSLTLYDPAVHFRKVGNDADLPLLTGALSSLDGIALRDLHRDRPNRDAAAMTATGETVTGN